MRVHMHIYHYDALAFVILALFAVGVWIRQTIKGRHSAENYWNFWLAFAMLGFVIGGLIDAFDKVESVFYVPLIVGFITGPAIQSWYEARRRTQDHAEGGLGAGRKGTQDKVRDDRPGLVVLGAI